MTVQTEIRNLLECHVVGPDGEPIGEVGQVYLDERTEEPQWVTVRMGFLGMRQPFVPLAGAHRSGHEIRVPFDRETIHEAPHIDVDGHLTAAEEMELYRHYGLGPSIPPQRAGDHDNSL
ncbi:PRC-barrel domain-containing protein [Nonomuraea turkmeniaca]|uniref:PRC-barrel domain-containing protein n=1 Tax=Nonomuraea turkmeniaca TaxID=103838 RepID=UPI0014772804|nr:PRC-barrel domain-containing protein [Nonomuraea turkmeniaca]